MVTDPFAELFQLYENNHDFIKERLDELQSLTSHEFFTELVERWRDEFGMHNDDSTLILITDCTENNINIAYADNLDLLCQNEQKLLNVQLLNHTNSSSITTNNEQEIASSEELSQNEAVESFKSSFENLMPYYAGKKSIGKITDWIKSILKPLIDTLTKS